MTFLVVLRRHQQYTANSGFPLVLESHEKSRNLRKEFFRLEKSWKMTVVMESHTKVIEFHQYA